MTPDKYVRRPFAVDAKQVTDENMAEVATWCGGTIVEESGPEKRHIYVTVHNPMNDRQKKAFANDWILFAGKSYKVYTDRAFTRTFVKEGGIPDGPNSNVFDSSHGRQAPKPGPQMAHANNPHNETNVFDK